MGPDLDFDEITVGRQGLRAGRLSDNSLTLNHREISRQHFRITWREDDRFLVEDLNSSNGVFLNDARLVARVAQILSEGDIIRAGPFLLTFMRIEYPEPEILERPQIAFDDEPLAPVSPSKNGYFAGYSARPKQLVKVFACNLWR